MITITLYKNGVEIKGHMNPVNCGEVSVLTWNCSNSMAKWDSKSKGDHTQNGYSYFAFDTNNKKSVFLFDEYKRNLKIWSDYMWNKNEFVINEVDEVLNLDELK